MFIVLCCLFAVNGAAEAGWFRPGPLRLSVLSTHHQAASLYSLAVALTLPVVAAPSSMYTKLGKRFFKASLIVLPLLCGAAQVAQGSAEPLRSPHATALALLLVFLAAVQPR